MNPFRRVHHWLLTWWLMVPHPRVINAIVIVVYVTAYLSLGGVSTLVKPPNSIVGAIGSAAMAGVGSLFLLGSIVAIAGCVRDWWEFERVGIYTMGIGALIYAAIVIGLHASNPGSRLLQLGMLLGAMGFLALRLALIWRYEYKPREGFDDADQLPR